MTRQTPASTGEPATVPGAQRRHQILVLAGLLILAFNLRPTAVAVGPLLSTITGAISMSPAEAGVLTTLPVISFAIFGALSPAVAARLGPHHTIAIALIMLVLGQTGRALTASVFLFLASSTVALAGMAAANVLLPSLVKLHFPDQVGMVTALYSTLLGIGITGASVLTLPSAELFGSWRWGLGLWAITGLLALIPWVPLGRHDTAADKAVAGEQAHVRLSDVARTRLGWVMAIFFGVQSMHAYCIFGWLVTIYQAAGYSQAAASLYLGITTGIGIPLSFLAPAYAARRARPYDLMIIIVGCCAAGYLGLLVAPRHVPWLWAALLALGMTCFPVILTLMGLRARTSQGTAALSGFTQGLGYLLAAPGPFLVGLLHEVTGDWVAPKIFLLVMTAPLLVIALIACRPRLIEDELRVRNANR
ncbi:MAG TPA: MFS transporter [Propionibacteriaceae bacterium]|nr:MFS transporter [Propionibacteriaceae bacterium]